MFECCTIVLWATFRVPKIHHYLPVNHLAVLRTNKTFDFKIRVQENATHI